MGTVETNDRPSGFAKRADSKDAIFPSPTPKKSPIGQSTAGFDSPSQNIWSLMSRRCSAFLGIVPLIQILRIMPEPLISPSAKVCPGATTTNASPFAPWLVLPALPFAPVGFSGLIHLVCSSDIRNKS